MSYQIGAGCKLCGKCQKVCPADAIILSDQHYVIVQEKCRSCGACMAECPKGAIDFSEATENLEFQYVAAKLPVYGRKRRHFHHAGHRRLNLCRCRRKDERL